MTYFITIEELKQTTFNANLDDEYIVPALEEAQSIYLREIIGDLLYNSITSKIDSETLSGKYLTLVNQYIKPYLTYKVQSVIVIPLNNKTRNAGIINQYDQGFNTSTMKDTAYLADYYNSRAEFYANRLTTYLQKNSADFPEYGYSDDNITQPTETQNVTTIFLGGGRKKGCGCSTTPQATSKTVDWDNIENKPDFADVAYTNDYDSLDNKPEIPAPQVQSDWNQTDTNEVDYIKNKPTIPTVPTNVSSFNNDAGYITQEQVLAYKPFPATWTTDHTMSDLVASIEHDTNATVGKSYMDTVHLTDLPEDMVQAEVKVDVVSEIDNLGKVLVFTITSDSTKPYHWECTSAYGTVSAWHSWVLPTDLPSVNNGKLTITQGGVTKGSFTANAIANVTIDIDAGGGTQEQADWNQSDTTAVDYIKNKPTIPEAQVNADWNANSGVAEILNKPTIPANTSDLNNDSGFITISDVPAQEQADWNQSDNTQVDYIKNKPTIPAAPVQSNWNESDTNSLAYIQNKPTIPAAQVNADWNSNSGVSQILNKPSMTTETWTFTLSDNTTVTKTVWLQ